MRTTSRYENGHLAEVRLYPVYLGGAKRPISQMGVPLAADPPTTRSIIGALQNYSRKSGTALAVENDGGVIRVELVSNKRH